MLQTSCFERNGHQGVNAVGYWFCDLASHRAKLFFSACIINPFFTRQLLAEINKQTDHASHRSNKDRLDSVVKTHVREVLLVTSYITETHPQY